MRILIDDFKSRLPDGSVPDIIVRNYDAALALVTSLANAGDLVSKDLFIDHDLGDIMTGYDLMCDLEYLVIAKERWEYLPKSITCVSNNGAGRTRIQLAINKLYGGVHV